MDTTMRALERKMVTGDINAAIKLARIRDSLRPILEPCIILCPVGIGSMGDGWPPWNGYPQKSMRGEYVSIYFDMGDWRNLPVITTMYDIRVQLSNDFFLRGLTTSRQQQTT